jgi:tetratricopeptide (TPR) repeat protein
MKNTSLTLLAIACALAGTLNTGPCWAAAPPELNAAIADYNGKKYQSAIARLQKVSCRNSPYTHYYLGLCYQAIGNWNCAKQEFKWNYDNSKDAEIRYRSWAAYTALEKARRATAVQPSGAAGATSSAATRKDPNYNSNWGSAASLDKPAPVLNGSDYETVIVTPRSCGRR